MSAPEIPDAERTTCSQARAETSAAVRPLCAALPWRLARGLYEDALLVADELVANAIRHGDGMTRFSACVHGRDLVISVRDRSTRLPCDQPHDPTRPGGFGWLMIQHLARRVSVDRHDDGKTVTAVLRIDRPNGDTASRR
ncbi:ATP-binding protein [Streptomyces sp. SID8379]|uniref:ATP-binding protein n=1 Tax=unclassified Streptomyces TaxID=2593676 RepID=UPI0003651525|nr:MULTISPECIES: ATP-binding protein [unclassified Streptomyces]MYW63149.1 ATP-binding protein [Streptomyces sp. SID8379]